MTGSDLSQRDDERRFQLPLDSAPDAMVIVDVDGTIVLVNAQVEGIFGYAREELIGQPVEILVPDRFRDVHPSTGPSTASSRTPGPWAPGSSSTAGARTAASSRWRYR